MNNIKRCPLLPWRLLFLAIEVIGDDITERSYTKDSASGRIQITNSAQTIQSSEGMVVAWEIYAGEAHEVEMIIMRPQPGDDNFR